MKNLIFLISLLVVSTNSYASEGHGGKAWIVLILGIGIILYTIVEHYFYKFRIKSKRNTPKPQFFISNSLFKKYRNYFLIIFLCLILFSLFIFVPYKTKYYQCENYNQTRSLIIKKYLPDSYSMIISSNKLRPHTIKKDWCKSNDDSIGFVCKFKVPINENMDELLVVRKKALSAGDTKSVQELDEYIKSLSYKKYLYRFDPITSRLKEVISSSEEGEISNDIYQCEKTETNF